MLFVGLAVSEESTSLDLAKLICVAFVLSNLDHAMGPKLESNMVHKPLAPYSIRGQLNGRAYTYLISEMLTIGDYL
ncbi:MAG: hypothetical protein ACRD8W_10875 [Nitrososphaeraceae archaeon]